MNSQELNKRLEIERKVLRHILVSRNKPIEDLMTKLPLSDKDFKQALAMRDINHAKDKEIWQAVGEAV